MSADGWVVVPAAVAFLIVAPFALKKFNATWKNLKK